MMLVVYWPTAWRSACLWCRIKSSVIRFSECSLSFTWTWRSLISSTCARWDTLLRQGCEQRDPACYFMVCFNAHYHCSAWYSWMTLKRWAISWRSWWRRTTFWWHTRSALTCMKVRANSSCPQLSKTFAPSALRSLLFLAPQILAPCQHRTKTGGL